ncbi:hypothetical protein JTE90_006249 [Oedothorax gibbosus]|uniref:Nudix hydrolase domain-containing protein n=1 Tax=Oedothorax gibbosus TaxID=931172 RepID=A0AAV6UBQ4_9ARAC|nr:hypothetical protein JTE90_006249 [Oedothorax gibbosus]
MVVIPFTVPGQKLLIDMNDMMIIDNFRLSAGAVLINEEQQTVCLIRDNTSGEYLLPKGGKKTFETLSNAAQREVFEETGYENEVASEHLLGIQFRPNISGKPGEHKVVYWYYSKLTSNVFHDGTQDEGEDFNSEWLLVEDAIDKLNFEEDKILVRRGFQTLLGTPLASHEADLQRWNSENQCIRMLTRPSTSIERGFLVTDVGRNKIILIRDCDTDSWKLPSESCIDSNMNLCGKPKDECAPFLFELKLDDEDVTVKQWYHLEVSYYDRIRERSVIAKDMLLIDKDDALKKLKNNLHEMNIVVSAFKKL